MIRKAHPLDVFTLLQMGSRYQQEAVGHEAFTLDLTQAMPQALFAVTDPSSCVLVAVLGTEVVGFLYAVRSSFLWSSTPLALDQLLYVAPEHRGGSHGIGLIRKYEEWCKQQGITEIRLSVASGITEERTIKLYEALGYEPIGYTYRKGLHSGKQTKSTSTSSNTSSTTRAK